MAFKHPLRRSCAFCRARKIKCSNETICEACRRQGADCIYDFEPLRPKARPVAHDSARPGSTGPDGRLGTNKRPEPGRSPNGGSPVGAVAEPSAALHDSKSIAHTLEQAFAQAVSPGARPWSSPWRESAFACHPSSQASTGDRSASPPAKLNPGSIKYTGLFSLLAHDLVGTVTRRFGSLGCHDAGGGGTSFFLSSLAGDETQTMFDGVAPASSPLHEYGQRQRTQLIDVWFSVHPLSFLVSKTLLLREMRDGTHDEILLAVMLADASLSIGDEVSVVRGEALLRWAAAQLRARSIASSRQSLDGASLDPSYMYSAISTRVFSGISTAQALMLLGWNALFSLQIRRAMCYIGLAGSIATDIKEQMSSAVAPLTSSRINGIDVFDVEKELVAYLYWTTYSLSLWASLQTGGNGPFSALLPTTTSSVLLPITETSSVIIQLDLVSDNFSTLQKQKAVIREMWPLAHIANMTAYICALQPRDSGLERATAKHAAQLLLRRNIQQGRRSQDVDVACREINRVLMESVHTLTRQVAELPSRSLVHLIYHTMAIHFLFPVMPREQTDESTSPEVLERFLGSAREIVHIFSLISEQPQSPFSTAPSQWPFFPQVLCLAFDACARAMTLVDQKRRTGGLVMDLALMGSYDDRLQMLATQLYATCQSDLLNQGRALRQVRKQLKWCVRIFGGGACRSESSSSSRGSSNVPSPVNHERSPPPLVRASSSSDSDCMSTAGLDSLTPSFVSPMDTTVAAGLPSSLPSPETSAQHGGSFHHAFSPMGELHKPGWFLADELFHHLLDPYASGPEAGDGRVSDLMDLQGAWYPSMPGVMKNGGAEAMTGVSWDWPVGGGGGGAMAARGAAAGDMGVCAMPL